MSFFSNYQTQLESQGIEAEFIEVSNKLVTIEIIGIPKKLQGQGLGSKIMNNLISYADKNKIVLQLRPAASSTHSRSKLIKFYSKFGFIENKGPNSNPNYQYMYRLPKKSSLVEKIIKESMSVSSIFSSSEPNLYGFIERNSNLSIDEKIAIVNKIEYYRLVDASSLPIVEIPIYMLTSTQRNVDENRFGQIDTDKPIFVVKMNGVYYLLDGHHRCVITYNNSRENIKCYLFII